MFELNVVMKDGKQSTRKFSDGAVARKEFDSVIATGGVFTAVLSGGGRVVSWSEIDGLSDLVDERSADACAYINNRIAAGDDPVDILGDLTSFFDGDPASLF